MKRIVLTGGGTAGHVSPHQALIPRLLAKGYQIDYIGTKDGIERTLMEKEEGVTYHVIATGKLRRYFDLKNFTDPFRVLAGAGQALALMRKLKPSVVFSKGGFVAVPVVYAAAMCGVPVVSHESDMTPGLANKLCKPFVKVICTSFQETAELLAPKGVYTGTPLRSELFKGDKARALSWLNFRPDKPVLLVTGGSSGAQAINAAVRAALPLLTPRFQVLHLCGKGNLEPACDGVADYRQFEYLTDRMADALLIADAVVSRAGSNTLVELTALCKPTLYIPYPRTASRGEQEKNARSMEKQGYARVLLQEEMTPERLAMDAMELYRDAPKHIAAMKKAVFRSGTENVLEQIIKNTKE